MPFSTSVSHTEEEWTEIFESFFKPAWKTFNIDCHRTKVPRGSITKDIIENLFSASVVFADLTDSNPNVMCFRKPSIMVKAKASKIPFDVNDYNVFEYEYTPKGLENLKTHLSSVVEDIKRFPNKADNPVWNFRDTSDFLIDYYRKTETVNKLKAMALELFDNLQLCESFLSLGGRIAFAKQKTVSYSQEEMLNEEAKKFFPRISGDALTHWRITRYVDFTVENDSILKQVDEFCRWCQYVSNNLEIVDLIEEDIKKIRDITPLILKAMGIITERVNQMELR